MVQRPRRESTGNRALLVLVDSRGSFTDTSIVDQTVLVALQHFGFPFRIHDLAEGPLAPGLLENCAAAVIAQARLGDALSLADTELLASAVEEDGLGLVNFDGELRLYKPPLLRLFGIEVDRIPMASDLLRIGDDDHFINWTQQGGSMVRLKRPVTIAQIRRVGRHVVELAQAAMGKDQLIFSRHNVPGTAYEPDQFPAVLAGGLRQRPGGAVRLFSPHLARRFSRPRDGAGRLLLARDRLGGAQAVCRADDAAVRDHPGGRRPGSPRLSLYRGDEPARLPADGLLLPGPRAG